MAHGRPGYSSADVTWRGVGKSSRIVGVVRAAGAIALAMLAWTAVVGYGVLAGWWHRGLAPVGDTAAFMAAAGQMTSSEPHGDVAIALVTKGQVADEHSAGVVDAVNRETMFPVASMSKWVTAVGVMQLVREGRIDLDAPVTRYLTRWTLPASQFDLHGVTTRRLMSHTAGLTDGLGFADYRLDERVPTLEESLRAPRASSGQPTAIAVGSRPGSRWQYSGGGYLILQLLVEEVAQQPFATYMRHAVLDPLEFSCSSLGSSATTNVAEASDTAGRPAPRFQLTRRRPRRAFRRVSETWSDGYRGTCKADRRHRSTPICSAVCASLTGSSSERTSGASGPCCMRQRLEAPSCSAMMARTNRPSTRRSASTLTTAMRLWC